MTADTAAGLRRAEVLTDLGRWSEAREALAQVLATAPESAPALCLLAYCEFGEGRYPQMRDAARAAVAVDPDAEWAHRLLSRACERLGRADEALVAAEEAVRLAPDLWMAHTTLAEARYRTGDLAGALTAGELARGLAPDEPRPHLSYATMLARMGELRRAEAACRQALAVAPDHAVAHLDLGYLRLRRGRVLLALASFAAAGREARLSWLAANNVTVGLRAVSWRLCLLATLLPMVPTLLADAHPLWRAALGTATLLGYAAAVAWVARVLPMPLRRPLVRAAHRRLSTWLVLAPLTVTVLQTYGAEPAFLFSEALCCPNLGLFFAMLVVVRRHGERQQQVRAAVASGAFTRDRFGRTRRRRPTDPQS